MIPINDQIKKLWEAVEDHVEDKEEAFAVGFLSALKWSSEGLLGLLEEGSEARNIQFIASTDWTEPGWYPYCCTRCGEGVGVDTADTHECRKKR